MEGDIKTSVIPDEDCRKAGINVAWQPVNELGIFAYHRVNTSVSKNDKPSPFAPTTAKVFSVRPEVILFHPELQKLINEANGTFLSAQNIVATRQADLKPELVKLSLQYRSIIRACLESLQEQAAKAKGDEAEELQNYITIFYSVECIWHLCEILFVDAIPGDAVLPHLLDWVRFHFPRHERNAASMLTEDTFGLENHPEYWDTVLGSLLKGRIEVVRRLLKMHSASDSVPFRMGSDVLKSMPVYNAFSGTSLVEFSLRRKQWIVDTEAKLDAKMFASERKLQLIVKLAIGDEEAWVQAQDLCETWYEYLAGWLFFTEPAVKSYALGRLAKNSITKMGVRQRMKHLDVVLLAAMEANIFQVIKEIQLMKENCWFATHLTDLLYHSGCLESDDPEVDKQIGSKLRESFILDYGTLLCGHNSLWQVGLSYLDHCPTYGKSATELLLERLPLGSEARTHKIIREAKKRNLPGVVQNLCKVRGMCDMQRGRLGNALTWALKSEDGIFASYLANKLLREYCKSGNIPNRDLLDNLGSSMLLTDRLVFLGKYCEFHSLYAECKFLEAAQLLISLISSKITPEYFWLTLLTDAMPLLESDQPLFSANDVFTMMHYLEDKANLPEMKDKVEIIRLALARNLSGALIHEAQAFQGT